MRTLGTGPNMGMRQLAAQELIRYLTGALSARQLRERLAPLTWGVSVWGNEADKEMAGSVELALSEYEAGHLTEEELMAELRKYSIWIPALPEGIKSGAGVTPVPAQAWCAWASKQSSVESWWRAVLQA